jgi:hypothetical protein
VKIPRIMILSLLTSLLFCGNVQAAKPDWDPQWYLRLTAVTPEEGLRDHGNVLGQLFDSEDAYDRHDLPELNPFDAPYLTIIFPHNDWMDQPGNYTSDYHAPDYWGSDQWVFQVRSDDPYREVTLRWEDVKLLDDEWSPGNSKQGWSRGKNLERATLMERMWLEDMDTGVQVEATVNGRYHSYQFNMAGSTVRNFRWVLRDQRGKSPKSPGPPAQENRPFQLSPAGLERLGKPAPPSG